MKSAIAFAMRRPRLTIVVWLILAAVLGAYGATTSKQLHVSDLDLPGSSSAKTQRLADQYLGSDNPLVAMVKGPKTRVERDARRLAQRLDHIPHVRTLDAAVPGTRDTLRPKPDVALVLISIDKPYGQAAVEVVPKIRAEMKRAITKPTEVHLTGSTDIAEGLRASVISSLEQSEMIAAPLLLLVLLLVFRSPLAAALPLLLGVITVLVAIGLLGVANRFISITPYALSVATMLGLAVGVDYSLLIVSRFREELKEKGSGSVIDITKIAATRAGSAVVFAGIALFIAQIVGIFVMPGAMFSSSGLGIALGVVVGVCASLTALPALLVLCGKHINRWRFGMPKFIVPKQKSKQDAAKQGASSLFGALRHPIVTAGLVLVFLICLALPAFGLQSGPPHPKNLPDNLIQRKDAYQIIDTLGPGWVMPYEILVISKTATTSPKTLNQVDHFQTRLAKIGGVVSVMGPSALADQARVFAAFPKKTKRFQREVRGSRRNLARLDGGLGQLDQGIAMMQTALGVGANGADRLSLGIGSLQSGASRLTLGLEQARAGVQQLQAGLARSGGGVRELVQGSARLRSGIGRIRASVALQRQKVAPAISGTNLLAGLLGESATKLHTLSAQNETAKQQLSQVIASLESVDPALRADPNIQAALAGAKQAQQAVEGSSAAGSRIEDIAAQSSGIAAKVRELVVQTQSVLPALDQLEGALGQLDVGVARLQQGQRQLARGSSRLQVGGARLGSGVVALRKGGQQLQAGTLPIQAGVNQLANGLHTGTNSVGKLVDGMGQLRAKVHGYRGRVNRLQGDINLINQLPKGTFQSGFLTLAGIDGSSKQVREGARFVVNPDRGAKATRVTVISKSGATISDPLRAKLDREADHFAAQTGLQVRVGGPAAILRDFDEITQGKLPILIFILAFVTYFALIPACKSLVLPLIAVLLNVVTVGVAFGLLVLFFQGKNPILGGPGFLDAVTVIGIFSIIFGLSIDYAVFIIARIREGYELYGDNNQAISYGLQHTAGVVTGAAVIMVGVFLSFALSGNPGIRQLGFGLTVAVAIDATLVRLLLLPAAIKLLGDRAWYLPKKLDRYLPKLSH